MGSDSLNVAVLDPVLGTVQIFLTLQGEGLDTGVPAVFLRLAGCQLHCSFCDTPETWVFTDELVRAHKDHTLYDPAIWIRRMTFDEVFEAIYTLRLTVPGPCNLVITGGEPLVQQQMLAEFFKKYDLQLMAFRLIEIETNGGITPNIAVASRAGRFNVSVKLSNSGNDLKVAQRPSALKVYAGWAREEERDTPEVLFKFVVATERDGQEVEALIKEYDIYPGSVLLMPEGRTPEELAAKAKEIAELCIKKGYRYCPRLQVELWGQKKGV